MNGIIQPVLQNGFTTNGGSLSTWLKQHGTECIALLLQEFQSHTKELALLREQLLEKEEEIGELKAERNNTRLLLEHLECLVGRHEKSLRMTVVKRQQQQGQQPTGVASEVEVLKALKSLFEHHKALDEKVREQLRVALERVATLENEVETVTLENKSLKEPSTKPGTEQDKTTAQGTESAADIDQLRAKQQLCNGAHGATHTAERLVELQSLIDKTTSDLQQAQQELTESTKRIAELEQDLSSCQKDLDQSKEQTRKLQHDLHESIAQKHDQEARIATLESRYLNAQREAGCLREIRDKFEHDLVSREATLRLNDEKLRGMQERLKLSEQQLTQSLKRAESLPSVEAELQQRTDALTAAEQKQISAEERTERMQQRLQETSGDLQRALQREKINEDYNQRLSSTVDKLLGESNERLQLHLKERMQALEEKNRFMHDMDQNKKTIEQTQRANMRLQKENEGLHAEIIALRNQLYSSRTAQSYTPKHVVQSPSLLHNNSSKSPVAAAIKLQNDHLPVNGRPAGVQRPQKSRADALLDDPIKIQTLDSGEWEQMQEANVLANVQQAFSTSFDTTCASQTGSLNLAAFEAHEKVINTLSSSRSFALTSFNTDTQFLATMLQNQLDAINNEIRLLEEEKQSAEVRAEELESRVCMLQHSPQGASHAPAQSQDTCGPHSSLQVMSASVTSYRMSGQTDQLRNNSQNRFNTYPSAASPAKLFKRNNLNQNFGDATQVTADCLHFNQQWRQTYTCDRPTRPDTPRTLRLDRLQQVLQVNTKKDFICDPCLPNAQASHKPTISQELPTYQGRKKRSSSSSSLRTLSRFFQRKSKQQDVAGNRMSSHDSKELLYKTDITGASSSAYNSDGELSPGDLPMGFRSTQSGQRQPELDRRRKRKHELLEEAMRARTPFTLWNGPTIVAWLELWVGMPAWYVAACRANVKSGTIMVALSDHEIQQEVGISNPLHRLKLRLAIQEMISLTSPSAPITAYTAPAFGDMSHEWIGNEWLPSLGLSQYRSNFMECLVDARMLEHLTKKDLRNMLKIVDSFHRASLQYGILCLKQLNYNRQALEDRRRNAEHANIDVIVWSNERVMRWVESIGLGTYAENLRESGVHGSIFALDETFQADSMALVLKIPDKDEAVRKLLECELAKLLAQRSTYRRLQRNQEEQLRIIKNDDNVVQAAVVTNSTDSTLSWRKRFGKKDSSPARNLEYSPDYSTSTINNAQQHIHNSKVRLSSYLP